MNHTLKEGKECSSHPTHDNKFWFRKKHKSQHCFFWGRGGKESCHNKIVSSDPKNNGSKQLLARLSTNQLLSFFSSLEPIRVAPGGVYATYSKEIHSEGLWYRVKVVKIKADNAQIEYLDYGETGTVAVSSLRIIPQRFLELPFQVCNTENLLIKT